MAKVPVGDAGPVVQAEDPLGREALEQPVITITRRRRATFLGRLENQIGGAGEVARLGQ